MDRSDALFWTVALAIFIFSLIVMIIMSIH
jgi:hypothetical protein